MDLPLVSNDHRDNEFYSYRYATRLQKGDIVEIRAGLDLEVARFQARKSLPDVLNEYWWLKPSDVPAFRDLPLKISDIYYYHGGVPVIVLLTAQGVLARKTQIFVKKRDEHRNQLDPDLKQKMRTIEATQLGELLCDQNLLMRIEAAAILKENFPDFIPADELQRMAYQVLLGNFDELILFGEKAVEPLLERFFVTSNAKETERIVDTLIAIGEPALAKLDDMAESLSLMASPYYAKRINWTINQIKKVLLKKNV
ncbi:MAG: hypothetical protein PHD06_10335 [Bacteroidales bacterium]|jgi:hypothetical protein|nr:hypothetical protein [Bacteroidales bacterium]MDY0197559.1 hypothetical protein [Tenuifilaceae bacterium]